MTHHSPIKIIHWECLKPPSDLDIKAKMDVVLKTEPIRHNETNKISGLNFRWTFRVDKKATTYISFIAEQMFIFDDYYRRNEEDIWGYLQGSNHFYRIEFDKRKQQCGIVFELSPIKKEDVNLSEILSLLEEDDK